MPSPISFSFDEVANTSTVHLGPGWTDGDTTSGLDSTLRAVEGVPEGSSLRFEDAGLDRTDSLVVAGVLEVVRKAKDRNLSVDTQSLPDSLGKLLELSLAVPRRESSTAAHEGFVAKVGKTGVEVFNGFRDAVEFIGELAISFGRLLLGRARFRKEDFWITLQEAGVDALPIVSLISLLIGMILAFVGGMQLELFGATIYVVDLVGIAMAREMGCIMTGIIMSGRTGAAFAAQLGSMNVNQEIDAYETLGLSPMEFLALPRALALVLMMPFLTIYSDLLGFVGGLLVAIPLGISYEQFYQQLVGALDLRHLGIGVVKSFFFGIIVAGSGCYFGLSSGRSSAAVGQAATSAVVTSITLIIVFDAVAAMLLQALNI